MAKDKKLKDEIKEDIGKFSSFEVLAKTEGGKLLVESLESTFISTVDSLISGYKRLKPEKLLPIIAEMDTTLNMLRVFITASDQKEGALLALKSEEERGVEEPEES